MRDSFVVYTEYADIISELSDAQAGMLFKAIMQSQIDNEPDIDDLAVRLVYMTIKKQIDKCHENYDKTKKARSEAGKEAMKRRWNKEQQISSGSDVITDDNKNNKAITDDNKNNNNDNVNVNVNVKDKNNILSCKSEYQYKEVIEYLNTKAGTAFKDQSKDTRKHIKARFDDGFSLDDFKTVIDKKVAEWRGTDMEKYLRPQTLFGTKFESYLNQKNVKQVGKIEPFTQRAYDYDAMERELLRKQGVQ